MVYTDNSLSRGIDMQHLWETVFLPIEEPVEYKPEWRFVSDKRGTRSFKVKGHQVRRGRGKKNTKVKDMRHEQRS